MGSGVSALVSATELDLNVIISWNRHNCVPCKIAEVYKSKSSDFDHQISSDFILNIAIIGSDRFQILCKCCHLTSSNDFLRWRSFQYSAISPWMCGDILQSLGHSLQGGEREGNR